jgi:hypothetical protein
MLSLKFPVTMAMRGHLKIAVKIDFKVLHSSIFRVGYTLPYDQPGVIFSLSQVQNFLGDEGDCSPPSNPPNRRGHIPLLAPPDVPFGWGPAPKK